MKKWLAFIVLFLLTIFYFIVDNQQAKKTVKEEIAPIFSNQKDTLEKKLYKEQVFPTGKPRVFKTESDRQNSRKKLEEFVEKSGQSIVGYFIAASKSKFYSEKRFSGGGYHVVDFYIEKNLKNPTQNKKTIKIKLPVQFFKLTDKKFINEVYSTVQSITRVALMKSRAHQRGEITGEELDAAKKKMEIDIMPYSYVYNFWLQIHRGADFSIKKENKLVLFLIRDIPVTGSYEFHPNHIFSLGKGAFVDILLVDGRK